MLDDDLPAVLVEVALEVRRYWLPLHDLLVPPRCFMTHPISPLTDHAWPLWCRARWWSSLWYLSCLPPNVGIFRFRTAPLRVCYIEAESVSQTASS